MTRAGIRVAAPRSTSRGVTPTALPIGCPPRGSPLALALPLPHVGYSIFELVVGTLSCVRAEAADLVFFVANVRYFGSWKQEG